MKRREAVEVSFRGDAFMLPRPNLLDLVHLVANVDDPITLRADLRPHERQLLAGRLANRLVRAELAAFGNDAATRLRLLAEASTA